MRCVALAAASTTISTATPSKAYATGRVLMSVGEAFSDAPGHGRGRALDWRSEIDVWLDSLDDKDRDAVIAAFKNPQWTVRALHERLNDVGCVVSVAKVRYWRERQKWADR